MNDDMSDFSLWIGFISLVIIVGLIAVLLPRFVMELFKMMKLDGVFLGVLLLSLITSLPEMLTVIFSTTWSDQTKPVQGFSNIIGSNLMTGLGFAILDLFYFRLLTMNKMTRKLRWTTVFVLGLNVIFLMLILFPDINFQLSGIPLWSILVLIGYGSFCWWLFRQKKTFPDDSLEVSRSQIRYRIPKWILSSIVLGLIFALIITMFFMLWFSELLKKRYKLSNKVVGGLLFAVATASPEILSTWSLFQLGFSSSAFGVIIGSHLFNLVFFFLFDLIYQADLISGLSEQSLDINLLFAIAINCVWLFAEKHRFLHISRIYSIIPFMTIVLSLLSLVQIV